MIDICFGDFQKQATNGDNVPLLPSINPFFRVGSRSGEIVAKTAKNVFINRLPHDIGNSIIACLKLFRLGKIEKRTTS